jgi:hypothetical protein
VAEKGIIRGYVFVCTLITTMPWKEEFPYGFSLCLSFVSFSMISQVVD